MYALCSDSPKPCVSDIWQWGFSFWYRLASDWILVRIIDSFLYSSITAFRFSKCRELTISLGIFQTMWTLISVICSGLSTAVKKLHLETEEDIEMDIIVSSINFPEGRRHQSRLLSNTQQAASIGNLNDRFMRSMYLAAKGKLVSWFWNFQAMWFTMSVVLQARVIFLAIKCFEPMEMIGSPKCPTTKLNI